MSEEIIKSRIIKSVKSDLLWSVASIVLGVLVSYVAWQLGYVVYFFAIIPLAGVCMLFKGAYQFFSWKSHNIYENWELYNKNEQIPATILKIINEKSPKNDFGSLIVSENWLVFSENFNFIKYDDINWIYLNREDSKNKKDSPEIFVHTRFGKIFKASVTDLSHETVDSIKHAVLLLFSKLSKKSPSLIIGFQRELKKFWERDAKGFSSYAKSSSHMNEKVSAN